MKKYIFAVLAICSLSTGAVKAQGFISVDDTTNTCDIQLSQDLSFFIDNAKINITTAPKNNLADPNNMLVTCHAATEPRNSTVLITSDDPVFSDTYCLTNLGINASQWQLVIAKSGQLNLTCHVPF